MERLKALGKVKAVHASEVKHSPIGLGFEKLDRDVFDPEKAYDKVAALGLKWIRIQSGWAKTEKQKGVYDFAWLDAIVNNLLRRGLIPWMCLCYGNGLYDEAAAQVFGAVGCPPIHSEEAKVAWRRYVTSVTAHYKGKIAWYEVWNEPDGKWCWKHGPNGTEYGEFVNATAAAIKAGDPEAKVIGGVTCLRQLDWLNDMFRTGAAGVIDALSYHAYTPVEADQFGRVAAMRALARSYNPRIDMIQGETGTQSRSDGAGAMAGGAWTPKRQAKFLARHMVADLMDEVKFASYFSCLDMIEALNGKIGEKASYQDYGYFGVLAAQFDDNGFATGEYAPKPSYGALQTISAVFREDFSLCELPVDFIGQQHSARLFRHDDEGYRLTQAGFRRKGAGAAFVYWKPTELMTTDYESTVSLEAAALEGDAQLVDLVDGTIYAIPPAMIQDNGRGHRRFMHLPLRDYPLMLTFGEFLLG